MEPFRFDDLTRWLGAGTVRRRVLIGLAGSALGLSASWPPVAGAKKRGKRKRKDLQKKARPNEFGCLEVGDPCKSVEQCCSGICDGKKGERKCRAHGTGVCDQRAEGLCTAVNPRLTACNNAGTCACFETTAGSKFCANLAVDRACAECKKDADCEALGFPDGSVCVPFFQGNCVASCESGMACLSPCPPDAQEE